MGEERNREETLLYGTEREIELGSERFNLREYSVGPPLEGGVISPGEMKTGDVTELVERYRGNPSLVNNQLGTEYGVVVPYTLLHQEGDKVFGNYTSAAGQNEFRDVDLRLTDLPFTPPPEAKQLWDFAATKLRRKFTTDREMACLRSLGVNDGKLTFTIGSGLYSESFYSNGAEGVTIGLTDKEKDQLAGHIDGEGLKVLTERARELERVYGEGRTIRDILFQKYGDLPPFGEQVHNNSIGVAGMVLTERDGQFIYVKRGKNVSVNLGINCTASGAAEFDREMLSKQGLQQFLGSEMARETSGELGFKGGALLLGAMKERIQLELGFAADDYELVPVGFIRELTRGGKPECMFLIRYKGSAQDVMHSIVNNTHTERNEIDTLVYSQSAEEAGRLIRHAEAGRVIQHKGLVNLMLIDKYFRAS